MSYRTLRGRRVGLAGWHPSSLVGGATYREAGANQISWVGDGTFATRPLSRSRGDGRFSTRPGDSGSPALARLGLGPRIIGILVGGRAPRSADSLYASTFAPRTAAWLRGQLR